MDGVSFILTTLGDVVLPTEATSLLCLQSAPIMLSVLGGSDSLFLHAAFNREHFPILPSTLASLARHQNISA
jgi:hypothetical protein